MEGIKVARKDGKGFVPQEISDDEIAEIIGEQTTDTASVPEQDAPEERTEESPKVPAAAKPTAPAAKKVNLDDIPEFRNWKSQTDKERAAKDKELAELKARQQQLDQQRYQAMEKQVLDELRTYNPEQQQAAIENLAAMRAQTYHQQLQAWDRHMRARITDAGLDPTDERFAKQYPGGELGAKQFEADLATAQAEALKQENRKLKQDVSGIDAKIKAGIAETLRSLGFDTVDTGDDTTGSAEGGLERDARLLQMGQMDPAEFRKRYGT